MPIQILYTIIVIVIFVILVKLVTMFIYKDKEKSKAKNLTSIAIIDRHKLFRKAIGMALSRLGFQVLIEAPDGKEIINLLKNNVSPDIALVSTHLEGMNAIELVRLLLKFNPQIKILVLYMDPLHERPEKMIEAGAHGCIAKTADPEEIKTAISQIQKKEFTGRKEAMRTGPSTVYKIRISSIHQNKFIIYGKYNEQTPG